MGNPRDAATPAIRTGARNGTHAGLMKPVVAKLTAHDMMELAAYIASLPR